MKLEDAAPEKEEVNILNFDKTIKSAVMAFALNELSFMKQPESIGQWINIDTALPADGQHVLTYGDPRGYVKNSPFRTAIYEQEYGFNAEHFCETDDVEQVTHWMPLPKPPEENQR